MFPYIAADIGGTNARFALVTGKKAFEKFDLEEIQVLNGSDYPSFEDALRTYLDSLSGVKPRAACVAIAGPIGGDVVKMTNLNWEFSQKQVQDEFGFTHFAAINDFTALAIATSHLTRDDLIEVKPGDAEPTGNKAILGPGTGLGVAGLTFADSVWLPIPSEGGHVNVAPASLLGAEVVKAAIEKFGHVSAEMFISGPGLVNLYQSLANVRGEIAQTLEPKDITSRALDNSDALCRETLELFCEFTGALAGNVALTYGAKGGVYLGGGILPRFIDFLRDSRFNQTFANKGVMSPYVENLPVHIIGYEQTAFLGAAAWLAQSV